MEFIVGLILILLLLFLAGIEIGVIVTLLLGLIALVLALMFLFFVVCAVRLMLAKKSVGYYSRTEKGSYGFDAAYYSVDGEEYPNIFPCEVVMRGRLYVPDKAVTVFLSRRRKCVFDKNAVSCIIAGLAACGLLLLSVAAVFI